MNYLQQKLEAVIEHLTETKPVVAGRAWQGTNDLLRQQILKDGTEINAALGELKKAKTAFEDHGIANARLSPALDLVLATSYTHGLLATVVNSESVADSLSSAYEKIFPLEKGDVSMILRVRNVGKPPQYVDFAHQEHYTQIAGQPHPAIQFENDSIVHIYATSIGTPKVSCGNMLKQIEKATAGSLNKIVEAQRDYIMTELTIPRNKLTPQNIVKLADVLYNHPGNVEYQIDGTEDRLSAKGTMSWVVGMTNLNETHQESIPVTLYFQKVPDINCVRTVRKLTGHVNNIFSL